MEKETVFSKRKIYIALIVGLTISFSLLLFTLSKTEFRQVSVGTGNYCLKQFSNQKLDVTDPANFIRCAHGNYKQISAKQVFSEIAWGSSTFFWLSMALLSMVGRDLFYIIRIRILTKKQLSRKQSFQVIMLWEFASALAPGVLSGATVAMFILNREKIPLGKATAIVITTAFLDNLFFVLVVPILFLCLPATKLFSGEGIVYASAITIFWIGFSVFALLCLVLYLSLFQFPSLIKRLLLFVCKLPFLKRFESRAFQTGTDIEGSSAELKNENKSFWIKSFLATVGSWTSRYLVINCILQAFLHLNLFQQFQVLTKQFVLWLFLRISPTPGGSGVAEWAFGSLMSSYSSSIILLLGMALIWRLISYYPYLIIGSFLLPRWLLRTQKKQD